LGQAHPELGLQRVFELGLFDGRKDGLLDGFVLTLGLEDGEEVGDVVG